MYIVPIAIREKNPGVRQIWALLERNGTHLMSLDVTDNTPVNVAVEFAELNGLALSADIVQVGDLIFIPVDIDKTDFSTFYSWREVLPGTTPSKEVWRQFIWVSESLDVNILLNQIMVAEPGHTVYSVLKAYLKTNQ